METLGTDPDRARKIEVVSYDPAWPQLFAAQEAKGAAPETNLHVFSLGCAEFDRCRLFRDWLRSSAEDVALYARTKQELATRDWTHVQDYANAKHRVISEIGARAEAWHRSSR